MKNNQGSGAGKDNDGKGGSPSSTNGRPAVAPSSGGNWPSTTGNPSGGGRGNGPRKS